MANGRDRIRSIVDGELAKNPPDAPVEPALESLLDNTVAYLASDAAAVSLRADPYWLPCEALSGLAELDRRGLLDE